MGFAMQTGVKAPYRLTAVLETTEWSWTASDHDGRLRLSSHVQAMTQDIERLLWLFTGDVPLDVTRSIVRREGHAMTVLSLVSTTPLEEETEAAIGVLLAHYGITLWGTTVNNDTVLSSLKMDGSLKHVDRLTTPRPTLTFKSVVAEVTGAEAKDFVVTHHEVLPRQEEKSAFAHTVLRQAERQCFQAGVFRFSA